jgi:hypothetical protein
MTADPDPGAAPHLGADRNLDLMRIRRQYTLDVTIFYPFPDGEKMTKFDKT